MRLAVVFALCLIACDETSAPRQRGDETTYVAEASLGPTSSVAHLFRDRCESLRIPGSGDGAPTAEERQANLEMDRPAEVATMTWECADRATGAQVVAHMYLHPGKLETMQVEAIRVTFGELVRLGDAIDVAREYIEPLLTPRQRDAMKSLARRFEHSRDVRGVRVDTIGITTGHTGVQVLPFTRSSARWLISEWEIFDDR